MQIWESDLHQLGFRHRSAAYWQCQRRYELPDNAHLSIFTDDPPNSRNRRSQPVAVAAFSAFHVTFHFGVDHLHFYYHEAAPNVWEPGGHTSSNEILRYNLDPISLRAAADEVAEQVVQAWGGELIHRDTGA